jgi:hypothetical protein
MDAVCTVQNPTKGVMMSCGNAGFGRRLCVCIYMEMKKALSCGSDKVLQWKFREASRHGPGEGVSRGGPLTVGGPGR